MIIVIMEENTFSRKARLEDFLGSSETVNQTNKNHLNNDVNIQKNQKDFGDKKRIKP
jgi:hypothetical protein